MIIGRFWLYFCFIAFSLELKTGLYHFTITMTSESSPAVIGQNKTMEFEEFINFITVLDLKTSQVIAITPTHCEGHCDTLRTKIDVTHP